MIGPFNTSWDERNARFSDVENFQGRETWTAQICLTSGLLPTPGSLGLLTMAGTAGWGRRRWRVD